MCYIFMLLYDIRIYFETDPEHILDQDYGRTMRCVRLLTQTTTSDAAMDVSVLTSVEDRLSAQETQMTDVLRLLQEQTAVLAGLTSAREPIVVTIPAGTAIVPVVPQTPVQGVAVETPTEIATAVVPLETSTLTPPPTTTDQVTATPTADTPTTSAFVLTPEAKLLREFLKFQPGFFYGGGDPEAAGRWIVSHQRFHKLMRNDKTVHARLSGICLRGYAAVWWTYTDTHPGPTTWAEFRELFYDQYIPMEVRLRLMEEFLALRQGSRTLMRYMERFRHLLQFSRMSRDERLQIYYFTRGIDDMIAAAVVSTGATTLQEIFDKALAHETYLLQRAGRRVTGREVQSGQSSQSSQRQKRLMDHSDRDWRDDRRERGRRDEFKGSQFRYEESQPVHAITSAPVDRQRAQLQEYRQDRDQGGHDMGQVDRGQGPRSGDGQTGRLESRRCHQCGQRGHLRADCQTPPSPRQTSDQARD
ncbi:hypothetical protein Scep_009850 [Stephania cephalantha]|uniref:CCHC-type domain-containing protein n=1 Tax=Stephania cephalantha TaxID=152367 RepID=A0AAP0PEP4_9MAGN